MCFQALTSNYQISNHENNGLPWKLMGHISIWRVPWKFHGSCQACYSPFRAKLSSQKHSMPVQNSGAKQKFHGPSHPSSSLSIRKFVPISLGSLLTNLRRNFCVKISNAKKVCLQHNVLTLVRWEVRFSRAYLKTSFETDWVSTFHGSQKLQASYHVQQLLSFALLQWVQGSKTSIGYKKRCVPLKLTISLLPFQTPLVLVPCSIQISFRRPFPETSVLFLILLRRSPYNIPGQKYFWV